MSAGPGPFWTIQPTTLYFVAHYPTNGVNEAPDFVDPVMYDYKTAEANAKAYMLDDFNNEGVCTITPTTSQVVYPASYWDANGPN